MSGNWSIIELTYFTTFSNLINLVNLPDSCTWIDAIRGNSPHFTWKLVFNAKGFFCDLISRTNFCLHLNPNSCCHNYYLLDQHYLLQLHLAFKLKQKNIELKYRATLIIFNLQMTNKTINNLFTLYYPVWMQKIINLKR